MTTTAPECRFDGRYSQAETAKLLGVSRQTINRWVKLGRLRVHHHKITGKPRFHGSDIISAWRNEI